MPANGFLGDKARNYANMTAVGALIVFVMAGMGLATWVTIAVTNAAIDAHKEQTAAIKDVAVEMRCLRTEMRSIEELRREMREEARETHKLLRQLVQQKEKP